MIQADVEFAGGLKVNSKVRHHLILTDQATRAGGEDSAPAPYELFVASLATCAGLYVQRFCEQRELSMEGLGVSVVAAAGPDGRVQFTTEITVPAGFPEKYHDAVARAAASCAVKKTIMSQPEMRINVVQA